MMEWTFVFSTLILMFTISVETSSAFNFTLEPSDSIAAIGQPLLLNCQVQYTGSETVVISWQNNGNWLLDPTNQPWTYLANNSLYYRSIPARSIGTFRCGATIFGTSQIIKYSRRATVQAAFIKSEFNPEPGNATKRLGEDATFNCLLTESLPYASIHWEKNEQLYTTGETSQFHIPNTNATSSSLLLRNITFGSSGWYGCVAVNHLLPDQPQRSEKAYLTVLPAKDAPHINIHPSHKIAGENTPAIIQCQILGEPAPAISWTQDGQPVVPSSDRYILSNGSLYFAAPVHRSYAGQYICMGMNSHGSVSSSPILFTVAYLDFGFVENPSNRTATVGDPVSLNCIPPKSYPPQVTIQWYHNYKLIVPSADININSAGTITFAAIKKSDEGIYFCDVTNAFVQVTRASTTAYVTVHVPPSFQVKPSNTNVTLGHPLALNCQAMGSPLPDVTWSKDNQPVDKRHVMVLSNGSLTISATVVGDAGKYSCVASNVAGSSEAVAYVVIYVPPSLVSSSVNTTRAIGESVTFECSFNGIPNPGIQWFYHLGVSQVQLTSSAKLNLSGGLLEIKQIVKQDEGLYTCRAVNLAGQSNASVYLTVQVPASLDNSLVNVTVNASSPASFHCNASGDPQPNVTWFKSGTPLSTGGRIVIGQDSLTILNTVVSDAGQYSCNVSNGLNHHVGVAYLIVQVPPSITSFQVPLLVASGMNTTLTCEASGIPLPRITWHRNGSRISYPFVRPLGSGNYIVDNVGDRDGGVYTCVAENAAGRMTLSANLIVQVAPSSPVPISAIPTSSRSIQLSWKPDFDGHSPITGYKVEMKLESESYTTIEPIILGTSYSVHNLKPFTNYTFKISAINAVGESEGAEISNRTLEDAPSAPRHVTATALNSTAVNVTWYEPAEPNGRIKRYEIHYNAIGSGNVTTRLLSANQLTAVFDRLMHFTGYQFRVRAATGGSDLMWGNFSLNTNVTTAEAAPSAPPQDIQLRTLSSDSILVTWKPVPENSAHGIVRKYIVYFSAVGPHRFSTPRNESVYGSLNITLRSLFPWTQYNVSVQAFTVQAGPRSPWKQKQTEEAAPGVPSDFTIVAHSQQNITVYIASPLPHLRNGIILGYTVFYRPAGLPSKDSYSNVTTNSTGAITEVTLVNLTVYTEYAFRTAAFTSVGLGNLSEEKTMFTPEGVPGSVDHVTAIPLTYDSVNVSWLPPESPNGKITLYMITYNASDGNSSGSVTTPGLLTVTLADLTSNTTYYIFVTAKTSRGFGRRGVMVNATTSPYVKPPPVTSSPTTVQTTAVVPAGTDARTGGLSDERLIIIIVCIGLIVLFIMVAALYFCVIRPRRQPADQGYSRSKSRKDFRSAGPTAFELHGGRHSLQAVLDVHEEPSVADTNYSSDSFDSDWVSGGVPSPSPVPPLGASGHYAEPAEAFKSETPESAPHGLELRNKRISLNSQDSYYDQPYSSVEELGGGFSSFGPPPPLAFRSSPINEEDSGASDQSDDKRKSFTNELYKAMSGNEDKHLGKRGNSYEGPQGGDVTGVENKGYDDDDALNELLQNELLKSSNGLVTSTPSATSPTDLDALYAKPDKSKKKKTFRKNGVVSPPAADSASDCSSELGPINIDDLYAKPEKSKKQSRKHATMDTSTPDAESRSQKRLHEPSVVYDERTNLPEEVSQPNETAPSDKHDVKSVGDSTLSSETVTVSDKNSSDAQTPSATDDLIDLSHEDSAILPLNDEPPPSTSTLRNKRISLGSQDSFYDEPYSNLEEIGTNFASLESSPLSTPNPALLPPGTQASSTDKDFAEDDDPSVLKPIREANGAPLASKPYGVVDRPEDEAVVMEVKEIGSQDKPKAAEPVTTDKSGDEALMDIVADEATNKAEAQPRRFNATDEGRHSLQAVLDVHEEPSVADTNYSSDSFDPDWVSGGVPSPSPVPPLSASGHYAEPADAFKSETPESAPHGLELRNKRISLNSQDSYYDQPYSSVEELGGGFSSFGPPPPLAFRSSPINEEDSGASGQSDDKRKSFTNELYKAMSGNEDKHLAKRGSSYEGPQGGDITGVENKGYDDDDALNELLQNELLKSSNGLVTSTPSATSPTDLDALYAKPDKSKKKKTFRKNGVVSPPAADSSASDCSSELGPINIDDLYAKPEKSKKQSRKHATMDTSTPDAESQTQKPVHEPSVVYDERTNLLEEVSQSNETAPSDKHDVKCVGDSTLSSETVTVSDLNRSDALTPNATDDLIDLNHEDSAILPLNDEPPPSTSTLRNKRISLGSHTPI